VQQQECGTGTHGFLCRHFEEKRVRSHLGLNLNIAEEFVANSNRGYEVRG
jgi:hypothetical protein